MVENRTTLELKINIGGQCYYINSVNIKQIISKMPVQIKREIVDQIAIFQQEFELVEQNKGFVDFMQTIGSSWLEHINLNQSILENLENIYEQLKSRQQLGEQILPAKKDIFRAFRETTFGDVKVVLIGQDPYVQKYQAMGLSFSVPEGVSLPPSLVTIYKQLANNYPENRIQVKSGNLIKWAQQGVLLLNTILTVKEKEPESHKNIGWIEFTDSIIQLISQQQQGVVFVMWGSKAQQKIPLIDEQKHKIIKGFHPSPQAQQTETFIRYTHFLEINEYLQQQGKQPIDWMI